ncbi:MAG: hydrogenase expression/formation protein HypE [Bacteroidetes bacterium]|nr:hydrogenase expression/formation protein HypE [Bacteroidota bacterium]
MAKTIRLHHGSGGLLMQELIRDLFLRYFDNPGLRSLTDSAILPLNSAQIAFTTDSFVVDPLFFPGGDIGKLAVCGTVNDLAVSGAVPLFLSAAFIIEEGLSMDDLETIVKSMAKEASKAGVSIVTGDTKVVPKGKGDKLFINTAGIGKIEKKYAGISHGLKTKPGDLVLINGTIGDHGMTVMNARGNFHFSSSLESDCGSLNKFIQKILHNSEGVRFMRDATRGGLAAVLCEFAEKSGYGIEIDERTVPVKEEVNGMCELLGFDPLHVANEGKVVMVVEKKYVEEVLCIMKRQNQGKKSAVIGRIVEDHKKKVKLRTVSGGSRWIDLPAGEQLPRIC